LVVDDHEVVRRGVVDVVDADPELTVVAEAGTVLDAVRRAAAVRPDVAIVDLKLPDGTGIDVVRSLRQDHPGIRCVVLTSFDDDEAVEAALDAGASAFVLKSVRGTEIADVVRKVAQGRVLLDERSVARRRATHHDPTEALTPTERKVLELIGDGLSNREIGARLGLAEKTVKNHVTGLLAKMGFRRRTQAAAWVAGHRQGTGWNAD
jgi:DNA-binding NarL/FixJ family response regulator